MLTLAADNWMLGMARWIPTLPLLSMCLCGLLCISRSERTKAIAGWLTVAAIGGAFVCSLFVAAGLSEHAANLPGSVAAPHAIVHYFDWINIGEPRDAYHFAANFSFYIDSLTIVMLMVVTGIGTLIAVYANGYMAGDAGFARFFSYISLFIFAMACLVLADNLVLLYLGWEGVGAASYLLIGYYYRKPSAVAAAKKAFIVNRVGDFGFALGLMAVFVVFGTVQFADFIPAANELQHAGEHATLNATQTKAMLAAQPHWNGGGAAASTMLLAIPFLLMLGAFGKSAQLPLHVWLPDAMEGPTPVSALIHAATMVTAGVYMIARLISLFALNPAALTTVAVIGGLTALFAATIALCQYDLKRVWAYSTVSQLGYMFLGVGVLGTTGAIFHLATHAFFKALLFLTAGSVMHALAGQLDMRKISGLRHKMPVTCWLMFIGCMALAGVPFITAGFYSKDMIIVDALAAYPALGVLAIVTALLTAFYTFRLWFRVFWGPQKYEMGDEHHGYSPSQHPWIAAEDAALAHHGHADDHAHDAHGDHAHGDHGHHAHEPHEMPMWPTNAPLIVLAIGSLAVGAIMHFSGFIDSMIAHSTASTESLHAAHAMDHHTAHSIVTWVLIPGSLLMIALAWYFHLARRDLTQKIATRFSGVVRTLYNKYYIDELYDVAIRLPLKGLGWVCYVLFDKFLLDTLLIDVVLGRTPRGLGKSMRPMVRGALQGYGLAMGLGVVAVVAVVAYKLGVMPW